MLCGGGQERRGQIHAHEAADRIVRGVSGADSDQWKGLAGIPIWGAEVDVLCGVSGFRPVCFVVPGQYPGGEREGGQGAAAGAGHGKNGIGSLCTGAALGVRQQAGETGEGRRGSVRRPVAEISDCKAFVQRSSNQHPGRAYRGPGSQRGGKGV